VNKETIVADSGGGIVVVAVARTVDEMIRLIQVEAFTPLGNN